MHDLAERALEALMHSTRAIEAAIAGEDPVALATALDARVESVECLRQNRGSLPPEARAAMRSIADGDASLEARAVAALSETESELSRLRRALTSLHAFTPEQAPRFVSRRA